MNIGERIKEARLYRKLSQKELATAAGISRNAVSLWESGTSKGLKPENLLLVSDKLKANLRWIVFGELPKYYDEISDDYSNISSAISMDHVADKNGEYITINAESVKKAFIFLETHLTPEARAEKGPEWLADIFYRLYKAYTLHDMENTDPQMIMDLLAND